MLDRNVLALRLLLRLDVPKRPVDAGVVDIIHPVSNIGVEWDASEFILYFPRLCHLGHLTLLLLNWVD